MVKVRARKKIMNMKNNVLSAYSDTPVSLSYLGISRVLASRGHGVKGWHWPNPTSQAEWGSQFDFRATPVVSTLVPSRQPAVVPVSAPTTKTPMTSTKRDNSLTVARTPGKQFQCIPQVKRCS